MTEHESRCERASRFNLTKIRIKKFVNEVISLSALFSNTSSGSDSLDLCSVILILLGFKILFGLDLFLLRDLVGKELEVTILLVGLAAYHNHGR